MDFSEYQKQADKTAIYPNKGNNLTYPTLGLCGDSGEIAEKVKKLFRDNNGIVTNNFKQQITKELGDLLWYISAVCTELNIDFNEVARENCWKLADRRKRNVLQGSGDNR